MTRIAIAWELLEQGIPKRHIAKHLGVSYRTTINAIQKHGDLHCFLDHYQNAKKGSRQKRKIDAILKRRIWAIRKSIINVVGKRFNTF